MRNFLGSSNVGYYSLHELPNRSWVCGYCSDRVSSDRGYKIGLHQDGSGNAVGGLYICTNCRSPTFFAPGRDAFPAARMGGSVSHLPDNVSQAYEEARRCTSNSCFTAAVLLCRKILMNVSVSQGAKEGMKFIEYVEYLSKQGFVPPNGKHWVDHIRLKGNEATHEVVAMSSQDAQDLMVFCEMLLRFVYEFPALVKVKDTGGDDDPA